MFFSNIKDHYVSKESPPTDDIMAGTPGSVPPLGPTPAEQMEQRQARLRESAELLAKMQKYHGGERGSLNPIFLSSLPDWLQHCSAKGE